ncbi:hypothetical protein IE53DRAFT_367248 [Violaceomyces palustris]|uniref:Uncharacterized protein n=1 Tax=Violaceomyces palustris TaxID=1673888 RepID=A0ACD0P2U2_9BASI|nr:hypothetical protein IE53DRAFT_367248 [Violaceomyces palustris]
MPQGGGSQPRSSSLSIYSSRPDRIPIPQPPRSPSLYNHHQHIPDAISTSSSTLVNVESEQEPDYPSGYPHRSPSPSRSHSRSRSRSTTESDVNSETTERTPRQSRPLPASPRSVRAQYDSDQDQRLQSSPSRSRQSPNSHSPRSPPSERSRTQARAKLIPDRLVAVASRSSYADSGSRFDRPVGCRCSDQEIQLGLCSCAYDSSSSSSHSSSRQNARHRARLRRDFLVQEDEEQSRALEERASGPGRMSWQGSSRMKTSVVQGDEQGRNGLGSKRSPHLVEDIERASVARSDTSQYGGSSQATGTMDESSVSKLSHSTSGRRDLVRDPILVPKAAPSRQSSSQRRSNPLVGFEELKHDLEERIDMEDGLTPERGSASFSSRRKSLERWARRPDRSGTEHISRSVREDEDSSKQANQASGVGSTLLVFRSNSSPVRSSFELEPENSRPSSTPPSGAKFALPGSMSRKSPGSNRKSIAAVFERMQEERDRRAEEDRLAREEKKRQRERERAARALGWKNLEGSKTTRDVDVLLEAGGAKTLEVSPPSSPLLLGTSSTFTRRTGHGRSSYGTNTFERISMVNRTGTDHGPNTRPSSTGSESATARLNRLLHPRTEEDEEPSSEEVYGAQAGVESMLDDIAKDGPKSAFSPQSSARDARLKHLIEEPAPAVHRRFGHSGDATDKSRLTLERAQEMLVTEESDSDSDDFAVEEDVIEGFQRSLSLPGSARDHKKSALEEGYQDMGLPAEGLQSSLTSSQPPLPAGAELQGEYHEPDGSFHRGRNDGEDRPIPQPEVSIHSSEDQTSTSIHSTVNGHGSKPHSPHRPHSQSMHQADPKQSEQVKIDNGFHFRGNGMPTTTGDVPSHMQTHGSDGFSFPSRVPSKSPPAPSAIDGASQSVLTPDMGSSGFSSPMSSPRRNAHRRQRSAVVSMSSRLPAASVTAAREAMDEALGSPGLVRSENHGWRDQEKESFFADGTEPRSSSMSVPGSAVNTPKPALRDHGLDSARRKRTVRFSPKPDFRSDSGGSGEWDSLVQAEPRSPVDENGSPDEEAISTRSPSLLRVVNSYPQELTSPSSASPDVSEDPHRSTMTAGTVPVDERNGSGPATNPIDLAPVVRAQQLEKALLEDEKSFQNPRPAPPTPQSVERHLPGSYFSPSKPSISSTPTFSRHLIKPSPRKESAYRQSSKPDRPVKSNGMEPEPLLPPPLPAIAQPREVDQRQQSISPLGPVGVSTWSPPPSLHPMSPSQSQRLADYRKSTLRSTHLSPSRSASLSVLAEDDVVQGRAVEEAKAGSAIERDSMLKSFSSTLGPRESTPPRTSKNLSFSLQTSNKDDPALLGMRRALLDLERISSPSPGSSARGSSSPGHADRLTPKRSLEPGSREPEMGDDSLRITVDRILTALHRNGRSEEETSSRNKPIPTSNESNRAKYRTEAEKPKNEVSEGDREENLEVLQKRGSRMILDEARSLTLETRKKDEVFMTRLQEVRDKVDKLVNSLGVRLLSSDGEVGGKEGDLIRTGKVEPKSGIERMSRRLLVFGILSAQLVMMWLMLAAAQARADYLFQTVYYDPFFPSIHATTSNSAFDLVQLPESLEHLITPTASSSYPHPTWLEVPTLKEMRSLWKQGKILPFVLGSVSQPLRLALHLSDLAMRLLFLGRGGRNLGWQGLIPSLLFLPVRFLSFLLYPQSQLPLEKYHRHHPIETRFSNPFLFFSPSPSPSDRTSGYRLKTSVFVPT